MSVEHDVGVSDVSSTVTGLRALAVLLEVLKLDDAGFWSSLLVETADELEAMAGLVDEMREVLR